MRKFPFVSILLVLALAISAHADPSPDPIALDDIFSTPFGTNLVVGNGVLLANDTPSTTSEAWVFDWSSVGLSGSLVATNAHGGFTYDPGLFTGSTSFQYTIVELSTLQTSNVATVTIVVGAAQSVPDGGITLILLGLALASLVAFRRRFA